MFLFDRLIDCVFVYFLCLSLLLVSFVFYCFFVVCLFLCLIVLCLCLCLCICLCICLCVFAGFIGHLGSAWLQEFRHLWGPPTLTHTPLLYHQNATSPGCSPSIDRIARAQGNEQTEVLNTLHQRPHHQRAVVAGLLSLGSQVENSRAHPRKPEAKPIYLATPCRHPTFQGHHFCGLRTNWIFGKAQMKPRELRRLFSPQRSFCRHLRARAPDRKLHVTHTVEGKGPACENPESTPWRGSGGFPLCLKWNTPVIDQGESSWVPKPQGGAFLGPPEKRWVSGTNLFL